MVFDRMVDYFISEGFTYFDTAWMYCGFKSEDAAGEALVSRHDRNEFTLATKLHSGFFNSEEEREKVFTPQGEYYDRLTQVYGKPGDCISCGKCERICPQHLPIRNNLKLVASQFE